MRRQRTIPISTAIPPQQAELTCYLCGKPARKEDAQYCCMGVYRHVDCDPCAEERAAVARREDEVMAKAKRTAKATRKAEKRAQGARVAKTMARTSASTSGARARATTQPGASAPATKTERKPGLVDAAIQVMKAAGKPMNCKEVVAAILEQKLWATAGKTPDATLYSSILREIQRKGAEARFKKVERGQFALSA